MKVSVTIVLTFILCLSWTIDAQTSSHANGLDRRPTIPNDKITCQPFGTCERCPDDELKQPYCYPFGNRQLLHCRAPDSVGETPTWGPCGRIVVNERTDFLEFVACNAAFTVVGLLSTIMRSRRLAYQRSRALAARIGVSRV